MIAGVGNISGAAMLSRSAQTAHLLNTSSQGRFSNHLMGNHQVTAAVGAAGARVSVVVDAPGPLQQLAAAAAAWQTSISVLVEINAGQDRCKVVPAPRCHVLHQCRTASVYNWQLMFYHSDRPACFSAALHCACLEVQHCSSEVRVLLQVSMAATGGNCRSYHPRPRLVTSSIMRHDRSIPARDTAP